MYWKAAILKERVMKNKQYVYYCPECGRPGVLRLRGVQTVCIHSQKINPRYIGDPELYCEIDEVKHGVYCWNGIFHNKKICLNTGALWGNPKPFELLLPAYLRKQKHKGDPEKLTKEKLRGKLVDAGIMSPIQFEMFYEDMYRIRRQQ